MTSAIQSFVNLTKNIDPRVEKYLLVRSSYPMLVILSSYLYFCCKAGPRFMENRKPFQLKNTILVYNVFQILLSCYIAFQGTLLLSNRSLICEPMDYTQTPFSEKVLSMGWLYLFAKLTELLDTVFFVLRKKNNQVTFLHLYHHTLMPFGCWVGMRYFAVGHGSLFPLINCYIHIVMYTYYLIAGLGPQYKKYVWWKKQVTILQLVQFGIVFVHNLIPLFTSCSYPKVLHVIILCFVSIFIYLFGSFYIKNYVTKSIKNSNGIKRD